MDSENVEIEQSTTDLKYLKFVKEIAVKFLVLLSNVYDFAKENSGVLNTTVVSAENAVVSAVGPVYEKVKDLPEQTLVFVDDKFDKYAPALVKNLVAKIVSLIEKTMPLVEKLLTSAWSMVAPLIDNAISLLQKVIKTAQSLLQKILSTIQSAPLVGKAQALLQKGLSTATSLIQSAPLVGTAQSLLQKSIDTTKSIIQDSPLTNTAESILQKGPDLANQLLDTTKSTVGGIPLVGNVAQSLITNTTDLGNQLLDTTNSLVKENPVLGAVNSAAENIVKEAQAAGTKAALQSAYMAFKLVAIPAIAQFWYKANTYSLFHAIAVVILPVAEYIAEWYNKVVTYMDGKGYSLFSYLPLVPIDEMKAAYKLVKATMDGLSAVGDGLSAVGDLAGMDNNNN